MKEDGAWLRATEFDVFHIGSNRAQFVFQDTKTYFDFFTTWVCKCAKFDQKRFLIGTDLVVL